MIRSILALALLFYPTLSNVDPEVVNCFSTDPFSLERATECVSSPKEGSWVYLNNLGYSHYVLGNLEEATAYAEKALEVKPNSVKTLKLLAWIAHLDNSPSAILLESMKRVLEASRDPTLTGHSVENAISFEDHPAINAQCNYAGFASNGDGVGGGEALELKAENLYLDLLMRQLTHKSVQRSRDLDSILEGVLPSGCFDPGDPSGGEAPWDLPFSVLWLNRGEFRDLDERQCTWSREITDNCPATTMTAAQMLMTATLAVRQIEAGVEGDFIEAGVWRGGMTTLLRGVLKSRNDESRIVYAADSFSGIPVDLDLDFDDNDAYSRQLHNGERLGERANWRNMYVAGEAELKKNLRRVGLYDGGVTTRIVKGFFNETFAEGGELERVAGDRALKISLARLDSDAFESISDSLNLLWPHISVGGVVIVDDFHIPAVRRAVKLFREQAEIIGTAGPVLPISNDYILVCNEKANKKSTEEISLCQNSETATKDLIGFLEVFPTSAFFYKVGGVCQ